VLALAGTELLRSSAPRQCRQSEAGAGLPGAGPLAAGMDPSRWRCTAGRPRGLSQQVGTANGAHDRQHTSGDDHCQLANFLIVSSPVWVGLMPSLPPGFSESETLRQAGDSCRPGSPLRRFAPRSSSSNCALASASSRRRRSTSDSSARAALSRHAASSLASAP